jgi:hypothetical protein
MLNLVLEVVLLQLVLGTCVVFLAPLEVVHSLFLAPLEVLLDRFLFPVLSLFGIAQSVVSVFLIVLAVGD